MEERENYQRKIYPTTYGTEKEESKVVVDLGCGWVKIPDAVGIDNCHYNNDVVADVMLGNPIRSGVVDIVFANQFLEHIAVQSFIKECWRILKPNGLLHLETPNALYLFKVLRALRRQETNPYPEHIQTFTAGEIRNLLTRNGFTNPEISYRSYEVFRLTKRVLLHISDFLFPMFGRDLVITTRKQ